MPKRYKKKVVAAVGDLMFTVKINDAAKRAGLRTVVLPEKNKGDVEELDAVLTEGMNFDGITPPTIESTNSKPAPRGCGFMRICTSPNCPRPPVCFLYLTIYCHIPTLGVFILIIS